MIGNNVKALALIEDCEPIANWVDRCRLQGFNLFLDGNSKTVLKAFIHHTRQPQAGGYVNIILSNDQMDIMVRQLRSWEADTMELPPEARKNMPSSAFFSSVISSLESRPSDVRKEWEDKMPVPFRPRIKDQPRAESKPRPKAKPRAEAMPHATIQPKPRVVAKPGPVQSVMNCFRVGWRRLMG